MLNPFAIEKEIFAKLQLFQKLISTIQNEVSLIVVQKSKELGISLTEDLREKCIAFIQDQLQSKMYQCKVCGKNFDDGRKLGGHVSRAHKKEHTSEKNDDYYFQDESAQKNKKSSKITKMKMIYKQRNRKNMRKDKQQVSEMFIEEGQIQQ